MQVACDHRHLANISCNLRETIVPLQTSPATCGRLSYPYIPSPATCGRLSYPYKHLLQSAGDLRTSTNHLLQSAGDYRTPTNISCNLRETIIPLQTSPATCWRLSYPYIPSSATCGRLSYPYKHLLQLAGDYRTPTYHLLQLAGDYRTPTNISCNLRETFVPLRNSASAFFSLMICASYRKPYFCFIKIQYPEEIIRKYTQLSR